MMNISTFNVIVTACVFVLDLAVEFGGVGYFVTPLLTFQAEFKHVLLCFISSINTKLYC